MLLNCRSGDYFAHFLACFFLGVVADSRLGMADFSIVVNVVLFKSIQSLKAQIEIYSTVDFPGSESRRGFAISFRINHACGGKGI